MNGRPPHHLWAEAVRDIGILFAVFGPLDTIYAAQPNWTAASLMCIGGFVVIYIGVLMEAER